MKKIAVSLVLLISAGTVEAQFGQPERISPISVGRVSDGVGDMDGDGDLDVVVSSRTDGKIVWHENGGVGSFIDYHVVMETPDAKRWIAVEDFDHNGLADIVVGKHLFGDEVSTLLMNMGSGFVPSILSVPLDYTRVERLVSIDMNFDGDIDIVVTDAQSGQACWLENIGSGQFSVPFEFALPIGTVFNSIDDINGDSLMDVIVHDGGNHKTYCLMNDSAGHVFHIDTLPFQLDDNVFEVGDIDGDGDLDIVTDFFNGFEPTVWIVWLENDGTGTYSEYHTLHDPDYVMSGSVHVVNFDGGLADEILFGSYKLMMSRAQEPTGSVTEVMSKYPFRPSYLGDFNGDGETDIYGELQVIYGNGSYSELESFESLNNPSGGWDIDLADFDMDGQLDIVAGWSGISVEILHYRGNGEYSKKATVVGRDVSLETIMPGDINSDGILDIMHSGWMTNSVQLAVNDLMQGFEAPQELFSDAEGTGIFTSVLEDFDGDDDLDMIIVPVNSPNLLLMYRNQGNGMLLPESIVPPQSEHLTGRMVSFDIEGDGDSDLAMLSEAEGIVVLMNDGAGHFEGVVIDEYTVQNFTHLSAADFDLDGDLDILFNACLDHSVVAIYEYDDGTFIRHLIDEPLGYMPMISHAMDVDNDGLVDVVSISSYSGLQSQEGGIYWYRNVGDWEFSAPYFEHIDAIEIRQPQDMESFDRDHDGDNDIVFSEEGNGTGGSIFYLENHFWGSYRLQGHGFYDVDNSGTRNSPDVPFPMMSIQVSPAESAFFTNSAGEYNALCGVGAYTVNPLLDQQLWTFSTPANYNVTLSDAVPFFGGLDFGVIPNGVQPNAELTLLGPASPCNVAGSMWASIRNTGNTILSGVVTVAIDDLLGYISASPMPDSVVMNTLYFTIDSLFFNDIMVFSLDVNMPDETALGLPMLNELSYSDGLGISLSTGESDVLGCAFDPNDKQESTGTGTEGYISDGQWLVYTIRFQNTGNATATDIVIRDPLSPNLDQTTLTPISWSFTPEIIVEPDGDAVFKFNNILLPDSGSDFTGSQGFIRYKIKTVMNEFPGTRIENTAHIFFDQNPPITTNITLNTMECYAINDLTITYSNQKLRSPFLHPLSQQWYLNETIISGAIGSTYIPLTDGTYQVRAIYPTDCKLETDDFLLIGMKEVELITIKALFRPNPFSETTTIQLIPPVFEPFQLIVTDIVGREVLKKQSLATDRIELNGSELQNGFFLVYLETVTSRVFLGKLIRSR